MCVHCISDLRNWPIFSSLEPDFISQIHMVWVYGEMGRETLMVMKNKIVYAMGNNVDGCLGIGNFDSTLYPRKVEALCKKNIKTFAYGNGHVLALTKEGEVYSWGSNSYGELGLGMCDSVILTPTLVSYFSVILKNSLIENIVDIACGCHHSVVLTKFGDVYVWGQNKFGQVGNDKNINQNVPRLVDSLAKKKVICISCGDTFTVAVVKNGEVFAWGNNCIGQLGVGDDEDRMTPCQLESLKGTVIVKVACGLEHTLALTDEGNLYSWGGNDFGQLGFSEKEIYEPVMVEHVMGKVFDIAAVQHISLAIGEGRYVYIWGNCRGQNISVPTVTTFSNIYDALACYGMPSVMHEPLILYNAEEPSVLECLENSFDDETTSDLIIQVKDQNIFVHKAILKIRCSYFRNMFQHDWTENNQSVIKLDQFSYIVYKAFLKYLYTGMVNLPVEKMIELFKLADSYCESNLKKLCIRIIKQEISVSNVAYLYSVAVQYSEEELEQFCIKFAVNHMTTVTQTESFANLDENILRTFIIKTGEAGVFKM